MSTDHLPLNRRDILLQSAAAVVVSSTLGSAIAATAPYPTAPVKIFVAQGAGGSLDVMLRFVSEYLSRAWGTQVVVMNVPTGGGVVATRTIVNSAPDGLTLFLAGASVFTVLPETQPDLASDISNLMPIGFTGEQPLAIAVSPSVNVQSLSELIALSKHTEGGLSCAVSGRNGLSHLTGELFRLRSQANLHFVYYQGVSQALNDVIAGRVHVLINNVIGMAGAISGKQIRPLAVTVPNRLPDYPDIPSASETVPNFNVSGWTALVAPKGTPIDTITKIHQALRTIQESEEFAKKLLALGVYNRPMSIQQLKEYITAEQEVWRPLVREISAMAR